MFNSLSDRLGSIFDGLRKRGALTEKDVESALREVRIALLEADVALPVVKAFIDGVKPKAVGSDVLRNVNPGQMVVKIVHDHLIELLGEAAPLKLGGSPPTVILMAGLQGSGKTTTSGKLAKLLKEKHGKKVLLASLDVYRPAAQKQLAVLAEQTGTTGLEIIYDQKPLDITDRALKTARSEGFDVLILDTAGRLHIDEELMSEIKAVSEKAKPQETLLVMDAMTGQDAVNVASAFHEQLPLTGTVLTRVDSDARGGAALSLRHITGQPIKFLGMGEKLDALQAFDPKRVADSILGMGDVVALVEKAAAAIEQDDAEAMAARMQKGQFDLNDLLKQLRTMKKMGGVSSLLGMLPGAAKLANQVNNAEAEVQMKRQEAIILSMTPKERRAPKIIGASRKKRIAAGCGLSVPDVNRLLKQHDQMSTMVKKLGRMDKKQLMRGGLGNMLKGGGGGMPFQ